MFPWRGLFYAVVSLAIVALVFAWFGPDAVRPVVVAPPAPTLDAAPVPNPVQPKPEAKPKPPPKPRQPRAKPKPPTAPVPPDRGCDVAPDGRRKGRINTNHQTPGLAFNDKRTDDTYQLLYAGFQLMDKVGDVDGGLAMMLAAQQDEEARQFPWVLRSIGDAYAAKNCAAQARRYFDAYVSAVPSGRSDGIRVGKMAARMADLLRRDLPKRSDDPRRRLESHALSISHRVFARCHVLYGWSQAAMAYDDECSALSERAAARVDTLSDLELNEVVGALETCHRTCAH